MREFHAFIEAHKEYNGAKPEPKPMSEEKLHDLGIGDKVKIVDFKGGKNANRG